jgi:hypothetical protein
VNIGPYQVVLWTPSILRDADSEVGETYYTVCVRHPQLWFERNNMHGVYRWRAVIGWLDVRRFA